MRLPTILTILAVLLVSGCGYKSGVTNPEQRAYLYFTGDTTNISVSVDHGEHFTVLPGRDHQYAIPPGKHTVRVFRGGELVSEREVYVGDGIAKEIGVN